MNFIVNMFNHNSMGQRSLEDVIGIFGHQLRALGHTIVWDPNNPGFIDASRGINIIVEGFTPGSIAAVAEAHKMGCRVFFFSTEEPTEGERFYHSKEREIETATKEIGKTHL